MMNREEELTQLPTNTDKYEIVVKFTRYLSEDLECGGTEIEKEQPLKEALVKQFAAELQQAIEESGVPAGYFEVISGPNFPS